MLTASIIKNQALTKKYKVINSKLLIFKNQNVPGTITG